MADVAEFVTDDYFSLNRPAHTDDLSAYIHKRTNSLKVEFVPELWITRTLSCVPMWANVGHLEQHDELNEDSENTGPLDLSAFQIEPVVCLKFGSVIQCSKSVNSFLFI